VSELLSDHRKEEQNYDGIHRIATVLVVRLLLVHRNGSPAVARQSLSMLDTANQENTWYKQIEAASIRGRTKERGSVAMSVEDSHP